MKGFLDDHFMIYVSSTENLHALLAKINQIHPSIQMTMNHQSINNEPIEDKCVCPEQNKKPTDRNSYELPTSCHPKQTTKSTLRDVLQMKMQL